MQETSDTDTHIAQHDNCSTKHTAQSEHVNTTGKKSIARSVIGRRQPNKTAESSSRVLEQKRFAEHDTALQYTRSFGQGLYNSGAASWVCFEARPRSVKIRHAAGSAADSTG